MISKADLPFSGAKGAAIFVVLVILSIWAYRRFAPAAVQSKVTV